MNFLAALIELVVRVWHADSQMRDRSLFGEAEADRESRRSVARWCGGILLFLVLASVAWWWFNQK